MRQAAIGECTSSVWDRLTASPGVADAPEGARQLSIEQFKRAIARDLEALLNTRVAFPDGDLAGQPLCQRSILNFGLNDFAQLCQSDSEDRKEICARLREAIERHEPRLAKVRVALSAAPGMVNRLSFVISGHLRALPASGKAQFDVRLEQSSLHYSVS
ncbi:type VI secretion system baseplate subunit TssE [Rugamonas apoptosis]|uniref:Type VI secretion system baseplate subunit TssE n=1 Tax=Rugamonas apoptosis TaxID=2758570 RepID=A0A7W2FAL1_9BURK|nr:type VI secretion system baseplate subunit TssE [Rugamonas apoptosis]MBA5688180.1 type VI secretion system baseplate subunit TssE [Rugamonas apoptosis]